MLHCGFYFCSLLNSHWNYIYLNKTSFYFEQLFKISVEPFKEISCIFFWKMQMLLAFQRAILPFSPWKSISSEYIQVIFESSLSLYQVLSEVHTNLLWIHLSFKNEEVWPQVKCKIPCWNLLGTSLHWVPAPERNFSIKISLLLTSFSCCLVRQAGIIFFSSCSFIVNISQWFRIMGL